MSGLPMLLPCEQTMHPLEGQQLKVQKGQMEQYHIHQHHLQHSLLNYVYSLWLWTVKCPGLVNNRFCEMYCWRTPLDVWMWLVLNNN